MEANLALLAKRLDERFAAVEALSDFAGFEKGGAHTSKIELSSTEVFF